MKIPQRAIKAVRAGQIVTMRGNLEELTIPEDICAEEYDPGKIILFAKGTPRDKVDSVIQGQRKLDAELSHTGPIVVCVAHLTTEELMKMLGFTEGY